MDRFLTQLYQEEMSKQAADELGEFFREQPINDLEAYLGLEKKAVAQPGGDVEAPLPDSLPGSVLDKKMKLLDTFVTMSRTTTPPTREQASEVGHSNYGGPSVAGKKISPHHPDDGKPVEKHAEMVWADRMGRKLASACMAKKSEGMGDSGGMGQSGGGTGQGIETTGGFEGKKKKSGLGDTGVGEDKTAIASAKIASVALAAVRGAPDHIRKTAAAVAGQKIAAVRRPFDGLSGLATASPPTDLDRVAIHAQQGRAESKPRQMLIQGAKGMGMGALAGAALPLAAALLKPGVFAALKAQGGSLSHNLGVMAAPHAPQMLRGALLGAGVGGAAGVGHGAWKAHDAGKQREAIQGLGAGKATPEMTRRLEKQQKKEDFLRQLISGAMVGGTSGGLAGSAGGGHPVAGAVLGTGIGALYGAHSAHQAQKRRMALADG